MFRTARVPYDSLSSLHNLKTKTTWSFDLIPFETPEEPEARTAYFVQNYKQFIAARTIQRFVRGWLARLKYQRVLNAVKIIERAWLNYSRSRNAFKWAENEVQVKVIEHFHRSATIIQKVFRGWRVREYVCNMPALRNLQVDLINELMSCIAFKLHQLLKEHKIPGVYSIKNSECYDKVEELLSALSYRIINSRKIAERWMQREELKMKRHKHEECKFFVPAPYKGPNFAGVCADTLDEADFNNYDRRIYNILKLYMKGMRKNPLIAKIEERKAQERMNERLSADMKRKQNFCSTVIDSMQRWSLWDNNKYTIRKDVFNTPENVEFFLNEISSLLRIYEFSCHCNIQI